MTFLTILAFIAILAIVVLIHEWGHFIVARRSGARVEEFGFGFPPRLFSIRRGETLYSFNLLPLGGFVKIYGEEGEGRNDPRSFASKSVGTRARILAAGVTMNFILALVLLITLHIVGIPAPVDEGRDKGEYRNIEIRILEIVPGSPADEAGLELGDAIKSLAVKGNGQAVTPETIDEVRSFIHEHKGETIAFTVARGKVIRNVDARAREDYPSDEGPVGFAMERVGLQRFPFFKAIAQGALTTFNLAFLIVYSFYSLIRDFIISAPTSGYVGGPIMIFALTRQFTELGLIYIIQFMAVISLTLAILNTVPYPALDGGQLVYLLIEKIKGSPLSEKTRKWANIFGFASLITLVILISIRDVQRFF